MQAVNNNYSKIVLHQTRQQIGHLISLQIFFKFGGEWSRPGQPCRMTNGVTTPDHTFHGEKKTFSIIFIPYDVLKSCLAANALRLLGTKTTILIC
jgi:hypothetical protein